MHQQVTRELLDDLNWTIAFLFQHGEIGKAEQIRKAVTILSAPVAAQEPAGTLHDDGHFTWKGTGPTEARYAGWRADFYLAATVAAQEPMPPTLPRYLLDMIGDYGLARTDKIGELEVQHMWEVLIGGIKRYASDFARTCYAAPGAAQEPAHSDDLAVDRFAAAMKDKMAASRTKGRNGWDDPALCPVGRLQGMLLDHLTKGDPVDVGNFAMMLFNRNAPVFAPVTTHEGALHKLCGQLRSMRYNMFLHPSGGQHYSYLDRDEVYACIEEAERALAVPVSAQELSLGVSVDDNVATAVIQQHHIDGSVTVIYAGTHHAGDSLARISLPAVNSR